MSLRISFKTSPQADRRRALDEAVVLAAAGATEIVLAMPDALGPRDLDGVHAGLLRPLRETIG